MVPVLPMFFSTWETYHTHTLYLGYFNGPTEGLMIASILMAVSGYFGPQIWTTRASEVLGFSEQLGDKTLRSFWVPMILVAFFSIHLPGCIYHVVLARRKAKLPILPVFLEWTPMLIFCGSTALWLGSPNSYILRDNHLVLFCLVMSLVFGRLTTKIILHHLTKQPFPYWTAMLVPLIGGAIMSNLPSLGYPTPGPELELRYLQGYLVFAFVVYSNWAWKVIDRMCRFLDINCLTIKSRPKSSEQNGEVRKTQ